MKDLAILSSIECAVEKIHESATQTFSPLQVSLLHESVGAKEGVFDSGSDVGDNVRFDEATVNRGSIMPKARVRLKAKRAVLILRNVSDCASKREGIKIVDRLLF